MNQSLKMRVAAVLAGLPMLAAGLLVRPLQAEVPNGPPAFSNPLTIDNAFFPFEPNGLKVFTGSDHGTKTGAIDHYLTQTRTFMVSGNNVSCHILVEEAYEDDELVERSFNYFAQADDETVYYFGEVVNIYVNGMIDNHEGSWLVGGPNPALGDPPETGNAPAPTVFMPGNPELATCSSRRTCSRSWTRLPGLLASIWTCWSWGQSMTAGSRSRKARDLPRARNSNGMRLAWA